MRTVDLNAAKVHLPRLLDRTAAGEQTIIANSGYPRARLLPFEPRREPPRPGRMKGRIRISAHLDDPLPQEIVAPIPGDRP